MPLSRRFGLFVLIAVLLSSCYLRAQDDDDDDPPVPTSTLTLHYDRDGAVRVRFSMDRDGADAAAAKTALETALHCRVGTLTHPQAPAVPDRYLQGLPANQRAGIQKEIAASQARTWEARCPGAMTATGLLLRTHVDFGNVLGHLQKVGDEQLAVTVSFPKSKFFQHTTSADQRFESASFPLENYVFRTDAPDKAVVDLAFGYRPQDVKRALITPCLLLLLPLLITFWMRRAALRDAVEDPTAAWFSYFRVLNLCTTGTLLLWLCGWHIREGAEEILTFHMPSNSVEAAMIRVAVMMLPPWIVCLICLGASYRVYTKLRGVTWARGEFYLAQTLQVSVQAVPILFLIAGLELITVNSRFAMVLLASVYFSFLLLARLRMKVTRTHPEALTTGELRDRVFELAARAHTGLRQVLVMPAGRSQMANAFASSSKMVIFTDYLLARLNKREVLAIAAHEITHVQKKHAQWKAYGLIALIVSPMVVRGIISAGLGMISLAAVAAGQNGARLMAVLHRIAEVPELDLLIFGTGLLLFYLQSRMLEDIADAGAVRLTGDPEALITGLLKLGKLNLMPVQWGRLSGTLLTHPSTLKRAERIARIGQVPQERLQQIIAQYQAGGNATGTAVATEPAPRPEDVFGDAQLSGNRVVTTAKASQSAINKLWVLLFFHIAPALGWAWAVNRLGMQGPSRMLALCAGIIVSVAAYAVSTRWVAVWGRKKLQAEFAEKMQQDGILLSALQAYLVGLAPDPQPRYYVTSYNWDHGFLVLAKQRLCYVGDQTSFVLHPEEVRGVRLGVGVPSFFPVQRVYVDWWDDKRHELQTINLAPMRPSHFWQMQRELEQLFSVLEQWRANPAAAPQAPEKLLSLPSPAFGATTSRSIRSIHTFQRACGLALWVLLLAYVTCTVFQIPATVYVCTVVVLVRLYEHVPAWRWKEVSAQPQPSMAMAAGGKQSQG